MRTLETLTYSWESRGLLHVEGCENTQESAWKVLYSGLLLILDLCAAQAKLRCKSLAECNGNASKWTQSPAEKV